MGYRVFAELKEKVKVFYRDQIKTNQSLTFERVVAEGLRILDKDIWLLRPLAIPNNFV